MGNGNIEIHEHKLELEGIANFFNWFHLDRLAGLVRLGANEAASLLVKEVVEATNGVEDTTRHLFVGEDREQGFIPAEVKESDRNEVISEVKFLGSIVVAASAKAAGATWQDAFNIFKKLREIL